MGGVVGHSKARLGNPELSTSGLDSLVDANAKELAEKGVVANKQALRDRMIGEGMQLRNLEPDNAAHRKAFMSDLAANDKAIEARGGAEYENGEWWKDESNDGNPHTGSWEGTQAHQPKPDVSAGAGQMQGGAGGGAGGGVGGQPAGAGAGSPPAGQPPSAGGQGPQGAGGDAKSEMPNPDTRGQKLDNG